MAFEDIELLHTEDIEICIDQQLFFNPTPVSEDYILIEIEVQNFGDFPQANTGFKLIESSQICDNIYDPSFVWQISETFEQYLQKLRTSIFNSILPSGKVVRNGNRFVFIAPQSSYNPLFQDCNNLEVLVPCFSGNISVVVISQPACVTDPNFLRINEDFIYGFPHIHNCANTNKIIASWKEDYNYDNFFLYTITDEFLSNRVGNEETFADCANSISQGAVINKTQNLEIVLENDPNWTLQYIAPNDCCQTEEFVKSVSSIKEELLQINIAFTSQDEGEYTRTLVLTDANTQKIIAEIECYGQTVGEDERLKILLANFGQSIEEKDVYIFETSDVFEKRPDQILLNQKRKELLSEFHNIFPYLGSYKGLINAIKFFGYNENLRLKEFWKNVDTTDKDFGKYLHQEIRLFEDFNVFKAKTELLPNKKFKKTNFFGLFYDINEIVEGEYDSEGLPVVQPGFAFTNEEILIKLFGLREKLKNDFLPLNSRIVDVVGEGTYFTKYKTLEWSDNVSIQEVDQQIIPKFSVFKQQGWVQDLRPIINTLNTLNVPPQIDATVETTPPNNFVWKDLSFSDGYSVKMRTVYGKGQNLQKSDWTGMYISETVLTDVFPPVQNFKISNFDFVNNPFYGQPNQPPKVFVVKLLWDIPVTKTINGDVQQKTGSFSYDLEFRTLGDSEFTYHANSNNPLVLSLNLSNNFYTIGDNENFPQFVLSPNKTYEVRVRTNYGSGNFSQWVYTEIETSENRNPNTTAVKNIRHFKNSGDVAISNEWFWDDSLNAQSYEIQISNYDISTTTTTSVMSPIISTPLSTSYPIPLGYDYGLVSSFTYNTKENIISLPVWSYQIRDFADDLVGFFDNTNKTIVEFTDDKQIPAGFPLVLFNDSFELTWDDANFSWDDVGQYLSDTVVPINILTEKVGEYKDGFLTSQSFYEVPTGTRFKTYVRILPLGDVAFTDWQNNTFVSNPSSILYVNGKDATVLKVLVDSIPRYLKLFDRSAAPITNPLDLNYLIGNGVNLGDQFYEFIWEESKGGFINEGNYPDSGSQLLFYPREFPSNFYTWETIGIGDYLEMEWVVEKTFPEEIIKPFKFSVRGGIPSLSQYMVFLPYAGEYTITLNLFNGMGMYHSRIEENIIKVLSQQADFTVFTRFFQPELQTWDGNYLTWDEINSSWESIVHDTRKFSFDNPNLLSNSLNAVNYQYARYYNPNPYWGVNWDWDFFPESSSLYSRVPITCGVFDFSSSTFIFKRMNKSLLTTLFLIAIAGVTETAEDLISEYFPFVVHINPPKSDLKSFLILVVVPSPFDT